MVAAFGRTGGDRSKAPLIVRDGSHDPVKPSTLSDGAAVKWDQVLPQLPKGVLVDIDGHELAILCEMLHRCDVLAQQMASDPTDAVAGRQFVQFAGHVHRLSAGFGLNPADRARLKLGEQTEENDPFVEFLKQQKGESN